MNEHKYNEELELTDEMVARIDEIDNEVYGMILTLSEKSDDELPWDMEMIGTVTDAVKELLWHEFKLKVRHPAIITHEDGTQEYSDYDYNYEEPASGE